MNQKACCIEECKSSSAREQDRGVTFHRVPKEGALQHAWVTQGRLQQPPEEENGSKALTTLYICSRHFRKVDFELKIEKASKFVLKAGAIPTIFPWGITQLEELPKLYPDVTSADVAPKNTDASKETTNDESTTQEPPEKKETKELQIKTDAEKVQETATTSSVVPAPAVSGLEKIKEGYSSSADTESDKEPFEGNLVIDETAFDEPEPVPKKRRRRRTIVKPIVRRNRKPKVIAYETTSADRRERQMGTVQVKTLSELSEELKNSIVKQPPARKPRGPRKKKIVDPPVKPNPGASANSGTKKQLDDTKLNNSPMLRALIEKPNVPMIPPRVSVETSPVERKFTPAMMIPGAIVEAKDFSEQWYPAKIVEVDHDEKEVLIHYDNWSQRYDEWISMASPRLRLVAPPPRSPRIPNAPTTYCQGERCLARWSDNRRFPATIQAVLPNDKYEILFDDGFVRVMKWQHLAKGQPSLQTSTGFSPLPYGSRRPAPSLPAAPSTPPPPPPHTHLFDPHRDHLGSKEERRHMKRKINVKELFSINQGKRRRHEQTGPAGRKRFRKGSRSSKPAPIKAEDSKAGVKSQVLAESTSHMQNVDDVIKNDTASAGPIVKNEAVKQANEQISESPEETSDAAKSQSTHSQRPAASETERLKQLLNRRSSSPKQRSGEHGSSTLKEHLLKPVKRQPSAESKKSRSRTMSPVVRDETLAKVKKEEIRMTNECVPLEAADLSRLLKDEWSCKWVDNQPVGEVTVAPPLERGSRANVKDEDRERLERMTVKVADHRLPPNWSKFLTRRCVGTSAGKWDVVLMCPQGRRYRSRAEIGARFLEADGPSLLPYQTCLQDFSVHRKLARRLGWDTTSWGAPMTTPVEPVKKKMSSVSDSKGETLVKTEPKSSVTPKSRPTPEGVTPKPKATPGSTSTPKPRSGHGGSKQRSSSGNLTPKPRTSSSTPKPSKITPGISSPSMDVTPSSDSLLNSSSVTPSISTELTTPPAPAQPPLEDGYIYVGSLKVQIIGTLLRCPQEGCFKNFRKDNLLQMHIKHYHPEMIDLLGDTPNVADLAYARTIVEDVTPTKVVEKPHRVREKKPPLGPLTPKLEPDGSAIKQEPYDSISETNQLEFTPKKEIPKSEGLERSPKLRNLLLEHKAESPSKMQLHDVEDELEMFKIKQDTDGNNMKIKLEKTNKSSRSKQSKAARSDKELTKSQVMALINKIAERERGDRSRSQSPVEKHDDRSGAYEGNKTENTSHDYSSAAPQTIKSKKKRKRHEDDVDFKPSSSKKKKKSSSYLDIWKAYVTSNDDTRSSFGTHNDMSASNAPPGDVASSNADASQAEAKHEVNQMFINDNGEKIKIVHMKREEIINCYCGFGEEDGLMIQCELCLCWQHAVCHGIEKESQVPDKYICHICLYPPRGRKSQRHLNNQDWLYEGRLPRLEHQTAAADPNVLNGLAPLSVADLNRAQALKKSHQLCGNLLHVAKILHSLRCKIDISQKKDHPKLYLWSKPWDDKADVDSMEQSSSQNNSGSNQGIQQEQQQLHAECEDGAGMGDGGDYLDRRTEEMIESNIGPYGDITIDEVKLEVAESIEVSEVNEMEEVVMDDKVCDNVMELGETSHNMEHGGLLSSPGGTPIHLPITNIELKTLVKSVEVCAPQPEAAIDPSECRQRLLQHVDNLQMLVDARLDSIEAQIAELESQDPSLADDETPESYPRTKQTLQMLIRDLQTLEELGAVS